MVRHARAGTLKGIGCAAAKAWMSSGKGRQTLIAQRHTRTMQLTAPTKQVS